MHDSNIGRWFQEDPVGFDAGDTNLYRGEGNSPTNGTDPSGLQVGTVAPPGSQQTQSTAPAPIILYVPPQTPSQILNDPSALSGEPYTSPRFPNGGYIVIPGNGIPHSVPGGLSSPSISAPDRWVVEYNQRQTRYEYENQLKWATQQYCASLVWMPGNMLPGVGASPRPQASVGSVRRPQSGSSDRTSLPVLTMKDNPILGLPRVGSGLKSDPYHAFPDMIDSYATQATPTQLSNGATLYQVLGSLNRIDGRFEWIVQNGEVTHRFFVEGGVINGIPIRR